jgi:hypothetical protein
MLVVNLYGQPGAGKSTTRADVFRLLKQQGVNCEEVTEFAKRLTWEKRTLTLQSQPYIFGKQLRDIEVLKGQVDVIITDSPLLLCAFYGKKYSAGYPASFYEGIIDISRSLDTMDFFIKRVKEYNPAGRTQTEEQSDEIGIELYNTMKEFEVDFEVVSGSEDAGLIIANKVLTKLGSK